MAKIMSTLVGQGKGKIGAEVLYRANGEQFIRARAITVANPQSTAQMKQRLSISSAAKLTAALRGIIDHSFQNIAYGTKSVRHFQALAAKAFQQSIAAPVGRLIPYAPVLPKGGDSATAVDGLQISAGTLTAPLFDIHTNIYDEELEGYFAIPDLIPAGGTLAAIKLGQLLTKLGVSLTDQLTFIFGYPVTLIDSEGGEYGTIEFEFIRVNFKSDADLEASAFVGAAFNPAVIDDEKSTNLVDLTIEEDDTHEGYVNIMFRPGTPCVVSVIRSAFVNGSWLRSKAVLHCASASLDNSSSANEMKLCGFNSLNSAIASYQRTRAKIEDRFLNQENN